MLLTALLLLVVGVTEVAMELVDDARTPSVVAVVAKIVGSLSDRVELLGGMGGALDVIPLASSVGEVALGAGEVSPLLLLVGYGDVWRGVDETGESTAVPMISGVVRDGEAIPELYH